MKEDPKYRPIEYHGLKERYLISIEGSIRSAYSSTIIHPYLNHNKEKCVELMYYGKRKEYVVAQLIFLTFRVIKEEYFYISERNFLIKPGPFSLHEEDYGTHENEIHWKELKSEINRLKRVFPDDFIDNK